MRTSQLFDLTGKTALVTGGGRGIGRHMGVGLAEAGAQVFLASRKRANCEAVAEEIRTGGGRAEALECNLEDDAQLDSLVGRVLDRAERIDVLVNNAGMVWAAPTLEYPRAGWDRVFNLNVRALFFLSQQVAAHMKDEGGGSIIHVSSVSGFKGSREDIQAVVAYNASKGAVITLTKDMAVKLAPAGIRVNSIAPGPFLTDMMNYVAHDPDLLAEFNRAVPMNRSGGEDDIKGVAVFLASEAARFVTGHTLVVDGGVMAVDPWPSRS
jgi:gluconate 5-dehydrogenase